MNSFQKILVDCKKATLLVEKAGGSRLSVSEAIELKLHLTGCSICRLYQSQSNVISSMIGQILKKHPVAGLSESFKANLQNQIDLKRQSRST